jgi:hypothetical protein
MNEHFPDPIRFRVSHWRGDSMVVVLEHYVRVLTSLGWVTIPTGFLSDGMSIPGFAWSIVGPSTGRGFYAGLLHDYLYSKASNGHFTVSRKVADDLFLEALYHLGVPWHKRHAMHAAVRMFGGKSYKAR